MSKMYLIASLVCTHAIEIGIGRFFLPLIVNMLFVSINFSLEKDFVEIFPAFVNLISCCVIFELNKFAYMG